MGHSFVIREPVVDLRGKPEEFGTSGYEHEDGRLTQLLFGEKVEVVESQREWVRILALEQMCYSEELGWHPYAGWVRREEVTLREIEGPHTHVVKTAKFRLDSHDLILSYGTYLTLNSYGEILLPDGGVGRGDLTALRPLYTPFSRRTLIEEAHLFLGAPYLWGGRSFPLEGKSASVDCSGIVQLLYRGQGVLIPRDASDQSKKARAARDLLPGDLLYLAKKERVNHVVLKGEGDSFLEAPETGKKVRLLSWGEDLWEEKGRIVFADRPHSYQSFPARFLNG